MTNDYKENLLNYLTGNLETTIKIDSPYYLESTDTINENLYEYLSNRYEGIFELQGSVQCKDGKGNYNGKILYWGYGYVNYNDEEPETFLLLVDNNFNPLSLMTTYSSGYPLFKIAKIEVAEDGTMYGIDYMWEDSGQCKFRIVLFNNMSEIPKGYSTYTCILRNSYYIPGYTVEDDLNPIQEVFIKKSPQSATYYYSIAESTGVDYFPGIFKINVGSSNEWTKYPDILFESSGQKEVFIFFDSNDSVNTKYYIIEDSGNDKKLTVVDTVGENDPTYTTLLSEIWPYYSSNEMNWYYNYIKAKENGDLYIILYGKDEVSSNYYEQLVKVYLYNGEMNLLATKRTDTGGTDDNVNVPEIYYKLSDNNLFLYMYIQEDMTTSEGYDEIWFTMVNEKNDINTIKNTGQKKSRSIYSAFDNLVNINNTYNLYNFSLYYLDSGGSYHLLKTSLIYNEQNYNGEEYINKNTLIGKQGVLFDANNKPIFARNLYNYKVYNNRTISVLNVPNNMLNDVSIAKEQLIGETNSTLFDNSQSITKNIYEELFVNFFSTLKMQNRNESIYIENKEGAIRLNQSASNDNDYMDAKATKIRINYSDDTQYITTFSATITNNVATYEIYLQAPEDRTITSIDILSQDEKTLYTTIQNLTLTPGNYYKISQDCHIE